MPATVKELVKIHWPLEEIHACSDLPVATFYALLDDGDRKLLERYRIDIHGDRRATAAPEEKFL